MNNTISKYTCAIEDTLNGLTITTKIRKQWIPVIPFLFFLICSVILLAWSITGLFSDTDVLSSNIFVICMAVSAGFFGNFLFVHGLEWLLDREEIYIDAGTIRVEKSGFGSIKSTRGIPTGGKMFFILLGNMIVLNKSMRTGKRYGKTFLKPPTLRPMCYFLSGISVQYGIPVLERIKARYPQYDIYYRGYSEVQPDNLYPPS